MEHPLPFPMKKEKHIYLPFSDRLTEGYRERSTNPRNRAASTSLTGTDGAGDVQRLHPLVGCAPKASWRLDSSRSLHLSKYRKDCRPDLTLLSVCTGVLTCSEVVVNSTFLSWRGLGQRSEHRFLLR